MKERFVRDKYVENCRKIEMVEEIMRILKCLYKVKYTIKRQDGMM